MINYDRLANNYFPYLIQECPPGLEVHEYIKWFSCGFYRITDLDDWHSERVVERLAFMIDEIKK